MVQVKLYGGTYDGDEFETADPMLEIKKPADPRGGPDSPRMIYRYIGPHPEHQRWVMYLWEEKDGYVPR